MISRFFKKKPKPAPKSKAKPEPVHKAAPKKPVTKKTPPAKPVATKPVAAKPAVTKAPALKPVAELHEETYHFSIPSFKPGKIITAEGWKRMMMRKAGKK